MNIPAILIRPFRYLKEPYATRVAGYLACFLVLFVLFFIVRFPSEAMIPVVEMEYSKHSFKVDIEGAHLSFPPGITFTDVSVTQALPTGRRRILSSKSVTYRPSIFKWLSGETGGKLSAELLGGEVFISGGATGEASENVELDFEINEINPGLAPLWKFSPWGRLSGNLNGAGTLTIIKGNVLKSFGNFSATLDNAVISLAKNLMNDEKKIRINKGVVKLDYKSGRIKVEQAEITGDEINAKVSGNIIVGREPRFSRLSLKVSIKLSGELERKVGPLLSFFKKESDGSTVIRVGGTVEAPQIR